MLECLVYKSSATGLLGAEALGKLLREARSYNEKHSITGLLIYCDLKYIQLLEGDADALAVLYDRIRRDHRHSNIRLLYRGRQAHRFFPTWSMAVHNANEVSAAERAYLSNFLTEELEGRAPRGTSDLPAMRLLEAFAETLRRRECIEAALACLPA